MLWGGEKNKSRYLLTYGDLWEYKRDLQHVLHSHQQSHAVKQERKENQRLKSLKNMAALVVPVELFTLKWLQVNSHCEAVSHCQEKSSAYLLCFKIFQMWPPGLYPVTTSYMLTIQRNLVPSVCPEPLPAQCTLHKVALLFHKVTLMFPSTTHLGSPLLLSSTRHPFPPSALPPRSPVFFSTRFSTTLIHQPKDLSTNNTLKTDLATTDQTFCADSVSESEQMTLIECNARFSTRGIENFVVWAWPRP